MLQERTKAFNFLSGISLSRGGSCFLSLGGKTGSGNPASRARVEYFVKMERGVPLAPSKAVNADQASLSFSDSFAHLQVPHQLSSPYGALPVSVRHFRYGGKPPFGARP